MATYSSTTDVLTLANLAPTGAGAQPKTFWADRFGRIQSFSVWTVQTVAAGAVSVTVQGSLDGNTWVTIPGGTNPVVAAGVASVGTAGVAFPYIRALVGAGATVTVLAVGVS